MTTLRNRHQSGRTVALSAALIISAVTAVAQPDTDQSATGRVPASDAAVPPVRIADRHPDGAIGRMSITAGLNYVTIYSDSWSGGRDHQIYNAAFHAAVHPRVTVYADYRLYDFDGRRHELQGGFSFYSIKPNPADQSVNADGPVGGPVLTAGFGSRFYTNPDSTTSPIGEAELTLPVSTRLTVGAGYRHFEKIQDDDAVSYYASATTYFADYSDRQVWVNPYGPPGYPVVRLMGGGSSQGVAGELTVLFPLQSSLTLAASARLSRLDEPDRTAYSGGVHLFWHPKP